MSIPSVGKGRDGRRLLTKREVLQRVPWSASTLERRVRSGAFPRPVEAGTFLRFWDEREIDAAIEQLLADRGAAE